MGSFTENAFDRSHSSARPVMGFRAECRMCRLWLRRKSLWDQGKSFVTGFPRVLSARFAAGFGLETAWSVSGIQRNLHGTSTFPLRINKGLRLILSTSRTARATQNPNRRWKQEPVKPDPSPKTSPDRVFIVQFRDPPGRGSAQFAGRAEHVMSGQCSGFKTPEELIDFFGRVMSQLKPR